MRICTAYCTLYGHSIIAQNFCFPHFFSLTPCILYYISHDVDRARSGGEPPAVPRRTRLGLEMVFDKTLPIGGRGLPTGVLDAQARLVFLRSHTDHQVLGQARHGAGRAAAQAADWRSGASLEHRRSSAGADAAGQAVGEGVYIQSEGTLDTYPTAKVLTVTVTGNSFLDADGHFLELNEVTVCLRKIKYVQTSLPYSRMIL